MEPVEQPRIRYAEEDEVPQSVKAWRAMLAHDVVLCLNRWMHVWCIASPPVSEGWGERGPESRQVLTVAVTRKAQELRWIVKRNVVWLVNPAIEIPVDTETEVQLSWGQDL